MRIGSGLSCKGVFGLLAFFMARPAQAA